MMSACNYKQGFLLILSCAFGAFVSHHVCKFFKKTSKQKIKLKKEVVKEIREEIHEVLMFTQDVTVLKKSKHSRCNITASMDRLLHHVSSPKYSLDICMYVLTNNDVTNVLLKLNYKDVKIRIIVDADMAYASGSHIKRLERNGIPVRWMKSTNLMHHKFCIVDASVQEPSTLTPLVIMGSLNWTNQALSGNWEDVTVTSQPFIVSQYSKEFEKLWELFKPVVEHR